MCFSSSSSFAAAALLMPLGGLAVRRCWREPSSNLLPLALTPVLFGLQQALEGLVWIGLDSGSLEPLTQPAALAYLFFALCFWLAWFPWCALKAGATGDGHHRWLIRICLVLGLMLGLWLWLPLLLDPSQVTPTVTIGSIEYQIRSPAHGVVNHAWGRLIYGLIVTVPLLLTPFRRLRWFAAAIVIAFVYAQVAYLHAFSSVWCYLTAMLSALLLWVVEEPAAEIGAVAVQTTSSTPRTIDMPQ
ncbi:DUF6629 family protein [Synechococcus sp. 1G10]|uniref:DUF6629 family protein n=1 Tax=Synechococcus sp. 1G10 TaxID=2025605 RepID=UPI000B996B4C|nr:DUF6629 family protein [Synechococcus sp. 1G10]